MLATEEKKITGNAGLQLPGDPLTLAAVDFIERNVHVSDRAAAMKTPVLYCESMEGTLGKQWAKYAAMARARSALESIDRRGADNNNTANLLRNLYAVIEAMVEETRQPAKTKKE